MSRRDRQERGAALVEGAFAIPIFFVMVLGLVDFGMLAFESNKASNAARDGARIGIIDYVDADQDSPPSANYLAIKSEIESKLQGQSINLDVNCLTPGGLDIPCTEAAVDVDVDRISVKVSWDRKAISPIGRTLGIGSVEIDGESRMTIVGRPTGGTASPPPVCAPTGITVTPNPATRTLTNELANDLTVSVAGSGTCSSQSLWLISSDGTSETEICGSGCLGDTVYLKDSHTFWTHAGTARAELRDATGTAIVDGTFAVEDPIVPAVCTVSDVVVTPDPVQRTAGGTLANNLAVDVVGSGACTNLTLTLVAPGGSSAVICGPGNCLGVTAYSAIANDFWTPGSAQARITGEETFTTMFTVTDQPPCVIEITIDRDPAELDNQNRLKNYDGNVRQRVTVAPAATSGPCPELDVTMTPPSGTNTVTLCSTGPCTGVFAYTSNDEIWGTGGTATADATVNVTGTDVAASATFEVEE